MDEDQLLTLLFFGAIALGICFFGYSFGQSNCDKNPESVEYWKNKYIEEQEKNKLLQTQILDVLINSYAKKLVWSVSGLTPYKIVCYTDYSKFEMPQEFKEVLNNLCNLNP